MTRSDTCTHCGNCIPLSEVRCPHCGQPGLFPNVRAANRAEEREALNKRYEEALQHVAFRGSERALKEFEAAVSDSRAVIGRSLLEADRLASSDKELYASFYRLREAGVRLPSGTKWDALRAVTDEAMFPGYKEHIRFAALSLDGSGLSNYGECFLVLRDDMIAHRASVFEENSVLFMGRHNIPMSEADNLPVGYRSVWEERGKLVIAKLAGKIGPNMRGDAFQVILLREGASSEDDSFVEVHIWGPMTGRTFGRVVVSRPKQRAGRAILRALGEKLAKVGVMVDTIAEVA